MTNDMVDIPISGKETHTVVTPAVLFSNVKKSFGEFYALDGINLSVKRGELYGLIGPNGAGKSTAIKILTGLETKTSGEIAILGLPPQNKKLKQQIGYMPQETALYIDLTVQENLEFYASMYDIPKTERKKKIDELLSFIDLTKWRNTVISKLSGGMQHRASLAVAMLPTPQLLVLDEPTVGVDPELRASFWEHFNKMQEAGTTILITTHYMDEALRCNRVGLINHGKIIAEGIPNDLIKETGSQTLEEAFLKLTQKNNTEV